MGQSFCVTVQPRVEVVEAVKVVEGLEGVEEIKGVEVVEAHLHIHLLPLQVKLQINPCVGGSPRTHHLFHPTFKIALLMMTRKPTSQPCL